MDPPPADRGADGDRAVTACAPPGHGEPEASGPGAAPDLARVRRSERLQFADRLDRELQLACRMDVLARRELGWAAQHFVRRRAYRRLGFVRPRDYARERLGLAARTLEVAAWMAERLDALPVIARALDRSELSWTQARLVCRVAAVADQGRWLALACRVCVEELERRVRAARPPRRAAADPEPDARELDGEPAVRWRLTCPARVRGLWRRALALAAQVAGEELPVWQAAELVAAEACAGRPADGALGDRLWRACRRVAGRGSLSARAGGTGESAAARSMSTARATTTAADLMPGVHTATDATIDATVGANAPGSAGALAEPAARSDDAARANVMPADPFALDARLVAAVAALRTTEPRIGRLLRVLVDQRFHRLLGFPSVEAYVRERLGLAARTAWALLKVERATGRSPAFARAYHEGTLSWTRALVLLPVLERANAAAWLARAATVTVRRLADEVNWVLEARDCLGPEMPLDPPPLDARLTSLVAAAEMPAAASAAKAETAPAAATAVAVAAAEVEVAATRVATGAQCHPAGLEAGLQIGAHGTGRELPAAGCQKTSPGIDVRDAILETADRDTRARAEVCDVEIAFTGPASVVAFLRDVLDAFARPGAPRWAALEAVLRHVIAYWESLPPHRDPIFGRDGWRCTVPACSARRHLHDHHLRFRSRGGGNARANRIAVCAAHHLHGLHDGTIRAAGTAPDAIHWELGVRAGRPPLLTFVGDRLCAPAPRPGATGAPPRACAGR